MRYIRHIMHMLGGSQIKDTCPGEGNRAVWGPDSNITDSPDSRKQIGKITGIEITGIPDNRKSQLSFAAWGPARGPADFLIC